MKNIKIDSIIEWSNGTEYIVWSNGTKEWYFKKELHREDGPAIKKSNGDCAWYRHGLLHREDGAAIEYGDGGKVYCLEGNYYNKLIFNIILFFRKLMSR